ncbi:hypothetical protein MHC_02950 [Mycoplasma haemocanis str. Illinois]|uniref:Uncharacterized protein n=1 Tax=Mycoplasma haemocanis (strain Illinois) TaxID=1111676 RepID=H6N730_MYCHN|nr:hypothetical protein [Mycoplasma haemocanis]AEW45452.1 hypothetical protein MHC_02950 [Mycoplasma haemocanis str. Illinois]
MGTLIKIALGTGGVVGIGGGGVLAYKMIQSSEVSIKELFSKEKTKVLLKLDGDSEAWSANWKSYKTNDPWGLKKGNGDTVPTEFKNKCTSLLEEKVTDSKAKLYSEFLSYCSRGKTITDKLSSEGRVLVKDNEDSSFWTGKFDEYKSTTNQKKLPNIDIGSSEQHSQSTSLDKLKNGCKVATQKLVTDSEYLNAFENIKYFCTKESNG